MTKFIEQEVNKSLNLNNNEISFKEAIYFNRCCRCIHRNIRYRMCKFTGKAIF